MTLAGPIVLVVTVVLWMGLLWVGWSLVFGADASSVVTTSTERPAGNWDRVYYTAYTLFTLGNGEFKPSGAGWQIATGLAVANGLGLATLAITYMIPVMTAVTERRQQGATISGIGTSAQDLLVHAWNGDDLRFLDQPLLRFAEEINRTAQRHLTYPILHFFHSRHRSDEFAVSIATLDEALTIITVAVDDAVRPHPAAVRAARRAIGRLLGIIQASFSEVADRPPPPPDLQPLRDAGLPVVDDERFRQLLSRYDERRRALYGFTTGSTWPWREAVDR
ncbi:MAG: two pore domain potassium channel family protein [Actinobacteria bacterium]|nr:two pore domain potassium channel family protein [Actinomycetota bacterium]